MRQSNVSLLHHCCTVTFYMENLNLLPQMQMFILMDGQRKINKDIADPKFTKEVNIQKVAKTYNFFLNFLS